MNKHKRFVLICLYSVSMASIVSHAHLQDKEIASLIQQFDHPEARVHYSAAWNAALDAQQSLVEIGEAAVPAFIDALSDANHEYRAKVSSALAQIGMPAVPALIQASGDKDVYVQRYTAFALKPIEDFEHTLNEKTLMKVQKSK